MSQAKYKNKNSKKSHKKKQVKSSSNEGVINLHLTRRLKEGMLILTCAISVFLVLALITYHATDPGWSRTGSTLQVANIGGYVGAWLSDVLFYIFGYVAYFFPVLLAMIGWSVLQEYEYEDDESPGYGFLLLRLFGFVMVLTTASALAGLYFSNSSLPTGAGGIVGNLLSLAVASEFNVFGAGLVLFALLLTGLTLFSGLSWIQFIDLIGKIAIYIGEVTYDLVWRIFHRNYEDEDEEEEDDDEEYVEQKPKVEKKKPQKPVKIQINQHERDRDLFEPALEGSKPSLSLLDLPKRNDKMGYTREQLEEMSHEVELRLRDFGIDAQVVAVHPGPVVTRFELKLAAGTKVSRVTTLAKDLARSLSVISVRVVEVIPGKPVIGLEVPNEDREIVRLREILATRQFRAAHSPLAIALGKDISGHPVIVDLAKMPHLLVAGTTGSGKSVGLNAILLSLLYKYSPGELRMILIDPKMLELSVYDGIPHLLTPVVTDVKDASKVLRWCVAEMERRYKLMAALGVRNIMGYNGKVRDALKKGAPLLDPLWDNEQEEEPEELQELPNIVVLTDEFADMMMVVGKKVEELIARIAQKARAAGIHLILATQRPSVDVITGLIKANIPSRIAFQVSSKIDSRTILDQGGAEQLLGNGDMLYLPPGTVVPVRVHGAFVADDEVHKVVRDLKRRGKPEYIDEILDGDLLGISGIDAGLDEDEDAEQDVLYDKAVAFILETKRVSISSIQRKFKIGYNRAARIVEAMENAGLVSSMGNNGAREILGQHN